MKVCKCDRCGYIFEPHQEGHDFYSRVIEIGEETFELIDSECEIENSYDICEDCYKDFQRWFRRGRIKNKE